jgi:poly(3-hydroxybutyrate) depolymerase
LGVLFIIRGGKVISGEEKVKALKVLFLFFCGAVVLFGAEEGSKKKELEFEAGQEVKVEVDNERIGGGHFVVYVPSDYTEEKAWPVIFVYHGMNGTPTTWPFKEATKGKGFIVVGMGYVASEKGPMSKGQYINYFKKERRSILAVKRYVSKHLRVDNSRLFVTGYSKGGWHTAAILAVSGKVWRGAVIFAAGRSKNVDALSTAERRKALRGKSIYIGAGETDPNLDSAKKAASYYERLEAKVTFELFKGEGHSFDPSGSEILQEWLISNSGVADGTGEQVDKGDILRGDE